MFTEQQLEYIKSVAQNKKNQGELSVAGYLEIWNGIGEGGHNNFTDKQLTIIKYCAEECKRQHSGEMSVYDMINAWNYAHLYKQNNPLPITLFFVEYIGTLVEPSDNKKGFRTIPIGVWEPGNVHNFSGIWDEKADWREVPRLLTLLLESYYDGLFTYPMEVDYPGVNEKSECAEDEFYYQYEEIHPFVDGNGRSAKIIYNYLLGTLDSPIMPPNFWNISNP